MRNAKDLQVTRATTGDALGWRLFDAPRLSDVIREYLEYIGEKV